MGELHRARDLEVGRTAALRLLAPSIADNERARLDVLHAAQRVAAIEHPSIAAVYASGHGPDGAFIASEFVPGQQLSAMVHGTPLHPKRALDLAAQLADGLAVAQEHGVVHGALSSASVIVTPKGTAKLLDVGLVPWTRAGSAAPRDDVFGIGALLFEMLVGRPFRHGWPAELRVPELPVDVRPVLQQLVAPRPGEGHRRGRAARRGAGGGRAHSGAGHRGVACRRERGLAWPAGARRPRGAAGAGDARLGLRPRTPDLGRYGVPRRMSARFVAKAERATTVPMPAALAASMVAVSTCETKPSVGIAVSEASACIAASVPIGSVRGLLRSKITSDGASARIWSRAPCDERAKAIVAPACWAVVRIFDVNIRSSRIARIMA